MVFVPIVTVFSAISIAVLMFYDIDRSKHERNIEQLEGVDTPDSDGSAKVSVLDGESIPATARVS
jgi:Na+/melibiose symporter-like transporter